MTCVCKLKTLVPTPESSTIRRSWRYERVEELVHNWTKFDALIWLRREKIKSLSFLLQAARRDRGLFPVHGSDGGGARDAAGRHRAHPGRHLRPLAQGQGRGLRELSNRTVPAHEVSDLFDRPATRGSIQFNLNRLFNWLFNRVFSTTECPTLK